MQLQIGGWGWKTERSGDPHRESKPNAQRQHTSRIARTTRQINGAIDFGGYWEGKLKPIFLLTAVFTKFRPESLASFWLLFGSF